MASSGPSRNRKSAPDLRIKFRVGGDFRKDCVAVAWIGNKIVGDFTFRPEARSLKANGTFIELKYQKSGVATALWDAAIKKYKPTYISVSTTSEGGNHLVNKMMKLYPEIDWDHW